MNLIDRYLIDHTDHEMEEEGLRRFRVAAGRQLTILYGQGDAHSEQRLEDAINQLLDPEKKHFDAFVNFAAPEVQTFLARMNSLQRLIAP